MSVSFETSGDCAALPWFLVCRPARPEDLADISSLAGEVNIASMVPDEQFLGAKIRKSHATLEMSMSWQDGLAFFVSELHGFGPTSPLTVGSASLNKGAGGYWLKRKRERHSGGMFVSSEYLTFEVVPRSESSVEFSSNVVRRDFRNTSGLRIGNFQTTSRIAFLLKHRQLIVDDIGDISFLFATLLTGMVDGRYPFYEKVVRPFLGNIDYEDADQRRYEDSDFLEMLLLRRGQRHDGPQLPVHLVETAISHKLGEVREETKGAEKALSNFGFLRVDTFDALDGGRFVETTLSAVAALLPPRHLKARRAKVPELQARAETTHWTFTPERPMPQFICARALSCIAEDTLLIHETAFNKLELDSGQNVMVVAALAKRAE